MVILLSALAVVAAAIALVVGLVGGSVALIELAIGLALLSVVLLWAAKWIGSTVAPAGSTEPAPLPASRSTHVTVEPASIPDPVGAEWDDEDDAADAEHWALVTPVAGPSADGEDEPDPQDEPETDEWDDVDPAAAFPIADYDHLWATQIAPLLHELDSSELAMVEARERGGRHRIGVLEAIGAERASRGGGATTTLDRPGPAPAPVIDLRGDEGVERDVAVEVPVGAEEDADDEREDHEEPEDRDDPEEPGEGDGPAGPAVRMFLGRRRSPLQIQVG